MQLVIDPQGRVRFVYTEAVDLSALGPPVIERVFGGTRCRRALAGRSGCVGRTLARTVRRRSDALRAEEQWLAEHWLVTRAPS